MLQKFNKKILYLLSLVGLFVAGSVKAVCPVCVVAIGAGLGLSRWVGIDDTVSSIWIGALLIATIMWTLSWLKKKNWNFPYSSTIITTAFYLLVFVPLYYGGILGHPLNTIFGIDKIIFGTVLGTMFFFLGNRLHDFLKTKNNGKSYFSYQRVVVPVVVLLFVSVLLYILILWKII